MVLFAHVRRDIPNASLCVTPIVVMHAPLHHNLSPIPTTTTTTTLHSHIIQSALHANT